MRTTEQFSPCNGGPSRAGVMAWRSRPAGRAASLVLQFCVLFLFLLIPDAAFALQSHGAPEGLCVHQMAHIHFIIGLGYLYWDIKRSAFVSPGWRCIRMFCVLMLCWNIVAFSGHFAGGLIGSDQIFSGEGYLRSRMIGPFTTLKITYYLTKFDHLLAVPAMYFLYLALRIMRRSYESAALENEG